MEIDRKEEERLKEKIFDIFSKFRNASACERRQVYIGQLWVPIFKWCEVIKKFDFGVEIGNFLERITKEESNANIPHDKDGLIAYLYYALQTEKAAYKRKNESGIIAIPKEKNAILKNIRDIIKMAESSKGRKLTNEEREHAIYEFLHYDNKKYLEYIDLYNKKYVGSTSFTKKDDNEEIDILNSNADLKTPYMNNNSVNPLDESIMNFEQNTILKAVTVLLEREQDKDYYRALFTLYCINKNFADKLYDVLDQEMINSVQKGGKKPTQYEIRQKYFPEAPKESAEADASKHKNEFVRNLKAYLEHI